jgi:hypothetical protein
MHHERAGTLREALADAHAYAGLEARQLAAVGPSAYLAGILARPLAKFIYQAGLLGGWRDGWRGVLKLAIECGADVEVWLRRLGAGRAGSRDADAAPLESEDRDPRHYGRRRERTGPIRVAVVGSARSLTRGEVRGWLDELVSRGIWVTLIGPASPAPAGGLLRHHPLSPITPVRLMRALDAERQLGPLDATIALDRRAHALLRMIPGAVRSYSPVLARREAAAGVITSLREGP